LEEGGRGGGSGGGGGVGGARRAGPGRHASAALLRRAYLGGRVRRAQPDPRSRLPRPCGRGVPPRRRGEEPRGALQRHLEMVHGPHHGVGLLRHGTTLTARPAAAARRDGLLVRLLGRAGGARAEALLGRVAGWLTRPSTIAGIGSGTGHVAAALAARGHRVVATDVNDYDLVAGLRVLADGAALPFRAGS